MSHPQDRYYSEAHVWLLPEDDYLLLGITDHAQDALGAIEVMDLPAAGTRIEVGKVCGSLESLKTVSDLIAPLNATVAARNEAVALDPGLINEEPYDGGWLLKLAAYEHADFGALLHASAYSAETDG